MIEIFGFGLLAGGELHYTIEFSFFFKDFSRKFAFPFHCLIWKISFYIRGFASTYYRQENQAFEPSENYFSIRKGIFDFETF